MIRIVCKESDYGATCNVEGGSAKVRLKSFDIDAPELEAWLTAKVSYTERTFVGIEVVSKEASHD